MRPGLRTRPGEREAVMTAGFTVGPVARKAVRDGRLTLNEWHLLEFLTGNPGRLNPHGSCSRRSGACPTATATRPTVCGPARPR